MKASTFSKAMLYYLKWKVQLRRFLDGKGSISQEEIASPENCKFGKWLRSEELTKCASDLEMREIENMYSELHKIAKRIYGLKLLGHDNAARQEFQDMVPLSMKLVSLLNTMKTLNWN
ncbi:MAG: CZB domain-containing protein [Thermodesulfovibrionales bacterium]